MAEPNVMTDANGVSRCYMNGEDTYKLLVEIEFLRDSLERIGRELGPPTPDTPAPVANAYQIVAEALS